MEILIQVNISHCQHTVCMYRHPRQEANLTFHNDHNITYRKHHMLSTVQFHQPPPGIPPYMCHNSRQLHRGNFQGRPFFLFLWLLSQLHIFNSEVQYWGVASRFYCYQVTAMSFLQPFEWNSIMVNLGIKKFFHTNARGQKSNQTQCLLICNIH